MDGAHLRALLSAAAPAPWHYIQSYGFSFHPSMDGPPTPSTDLVCVARNELPSLLDELDRASIVESTLTTALREIAALMVSSDCADELRERLLRAVGISLTALNAVGTDPVKGGK